MRAISRKECLKESTIYVAFAVAAVRQALAVVVAVDASVLLAAGLLAFLGCAALPLCSASPVALRRGALRRYAWLPTVAQQPRRIAGLLEICRCVLESKTPRQTICRIQAVGLMWEPLVAANPCLPDSRRNLLPS